MDIAFHYPPELMNLLIDTIPLLCRSKDSVLLFFDGAGVGDAILADLSDIVLQDRDSIRKHEIVRAVLTRLNERGEATLRERREILKRVVEFEDFSTCWPDDQLKAKGLVSEIRRVINVKDSFTRIQNEREDERKKRQAEQQARLAEVQQKRIRLEAVKSDLYALFGETDAHKRGKSLEGVLNRLFETGGILVREAFALVGTGGEGIVEQIDGVVEIDGNIYLVEMKWLKHPVDTGDVSQHLVRVYGRGYARGIYVSASGYTQPAITICREALQRTTIVLCKLEEIVLLLERETALKDLLKAKITAAIVDKQPLFEPLASSG